MRRTIPSTLSSLTPLQSLILRRWRPQWICSGCQNTYNRTLAATTQAKPTKPYYITTPIFYVNAAPHVGHMYTMLLTDVLKRWQILKSRPSILLTGTDEHGMKIQQAALKANVAPKEFCDRGAEVFKDLAKRIGISDDIFIRTTNQRHKEGVEYAWQMLQEKGWIYESKHEGWYSVSDETFYPAPQVQLIVEPATGRKIMVSIETGKEVEWTSERNYHFRLSAFREKLLAFYEENPSFVVPKARMEDVVKQVTTSLSDLSISRPVERLDWGIRVPTDPSQTIYVWLDALLNYATASGYPFTPGSESTNGWPADVHVVGKDIVRFHCIYWPAFLMALDLPLPKQILTHAHWTLGRQKMAKSTGNVVNPFWALDRFGLDVMRWYLVHEGGIADDADYDNRFIVEKYKKNLQGGLGNLTSRIMRGKGWDVRRAVRQYAHDSGAVDEGTFPAISDEESKEGRRMYGRLRALPGQVDRHMRDLHPNRALQAVMKGVADMNGYLQQASPWTTVTRLQGVAADTTGEQIQTLLKDEGKTPEDLESEIDRTVYMAAETLRLSGLMLQAFIPDSAARLLDMLGVANNRRSWEWCVVGRDDSYGDPAVPLGKGEEGVLFPRLVSEF
ncbi:methionyl-tRNA synthetase [Elasticomyces elasticus]|nr:methionyl-tRNA synthetase [Elasticomyces elasticus]KAK3633099.1 methionyl-tRNA synthetase [Elasticomyces elasticus]KAK4910234.1 methionyl-tRNA synthetase [Elasticomyces elasticus]KAK5749986.1 methionyl-tRNA synthetase [Elasticomyces elasticus]